MEKRIVLPSVLLPRRRSEILSRSRLLETLHDLLEYKLNLVITPAGYGKTSLLIDFAHSANMPVCWYSVGKYDQELKTFLEHILASVSNAFPGFDSILWKQFDQDASHDVKLLASTVANELCQLTRDHFIIILDDFHFVAENQPILKFTSLLVQSMNENCHLFLASRCKLELPDLPALVTHAFAGGIDQHDLAFTSREFQDLALRNYNVAISEDAAKKLVEETEGWITGFLLLSPVLHPDMVQYHRILRATGVDLVNYWAYYIKEQPVDVQDFLMFTSPLEEFDIHLCAQVLETSIYPTGVDWRHIFHRTIQSNSFIQIIDPNGPWLRYHSLFRDYLLKLLDQKRPRAKETILRRLAEVYAEQHNWKKAYDTYQSLNCMADILNLIEKAGPEMIALGHYSILDQWLEQIPEIFLSRCPHLLSLKGTVVIMNGETVRGITLLTQAERSLRTAEDLLLLVRTLTRRSAAYHFHGDFQAALKDAQEAIDLLDKLDRQDNEILSVRASALKAKAASLYHLGSSLQALDAAKTALALYDLVGDFPNVATLHLEMGPMYRSIGDLAAAKCAYKNAEKYWRKEQNFYRLADLLNNLGVFYHQTGDFIEAALTLDEAVHCARQVGFCKLEAYSLTSMGDLYVDLDARQAAEHAYNQAYEVAYRIHNRFLCFYLNLARSSLACLEGNVKQADLLLQQAWCQADEISEHQHWRCHLEAGLLAQALGKKSEMLTQFNKAVHHFKVAHLLADEASARLYLANAYYVDGNCDLAFEHLRTALDLAYEKALNYPLLVAGHRMKNFLGNVVNLSNGDLRVEQLLEQVEKFDAQLPSLRRRLRGHKLVVPIGQARMIIHALGEPKVMISDRLITNKEWQSPIQRELFFFLLSYPDGVSRKKLEDVFWPDSYQSKDQCNRVIYKIRALLGKDAVLLENDRYQFNRSLDYEYDVETFLDLHTQARKEDNIRYRIKIFCQMLSLYKGHYLIDAEGSWVSIERERLWQACVDAYQNLAQYHLDLREYPIALDYCWRALEKEPMLEVMHRIAMRAYIAMGDRASAARQYQSCHNAVVKRLGIKPSKETVSLYHTLLS